MARARSGKPMPTDRELAILHVLWDQGPCTVRQVHEKLSRKTGTGYTTTLKLMQLMAGKKLVVRDKSQRTHVYRPTVSEEPTQQRLVGELLDRAFGGSAQKLMVRALSARKVSPQELAKIRQVLDELDGVRSEV